MNESIDRKSTKPKDGTGIIRAACEVLWKYIDKQPPAPIMPDSEFLKRFAANPEPMRAGVKAIFDVLHREDKHEIDRLTLKVKRFVVSVAEERGTTEDDIYRTLSKNKKIVIPNDENPYTCAILDLTSGFTRLSLEDIDGLIDMRDAWQVGQKVDNSLEPPWEFYVQEWIDEQQRTFQPETRVRQILPHEFKDSKRVQGELFPIGECQPPSKTLWLPGFDNPSMVVPALPIEAYKHAGGKIESPGRGAPLALRLWIYTIAAMPLEQRTSGGFVATTLRQLKNWSYPNGWERNKHLPRICNALREMHNYRIQWKRRRWNVIVVKALPDWSTKLDDILPIHVEFPDGIKGQGPMIDMTILQQLGIKSAPQFRAYLRLAYIWDNAKRKNNGKRIYATRPKALRNDRRQVIDNNGSLVPKNNWNHRNAVWQGEEDNPAACHVPVLTNLDMVHLFFDDKDVGNATYRKRVERAKREAEDLEKRGFIVIRKERRGLRLLEPRPRYPVTLT